MKKIVSVLILVFALSLTLSAQYAFNSKSADPSVSLNKGLVRHPMLHTGFFIRAGVFIPSAKYYYPIESTSYYEKAANVGLNFQLGTAFYFGPPIANMLRFGMHASWFEFSFATEHGETVDVGNLTLDMKFLGVGPLVSFSPMSKIAIDTYIKVMPTVNLFTNSSGDGDVYLGGNATYLFGMGFRFTKLDVGFETNWGNMNMVSNNSGDDLGKLHTNNTRLYIGVRF